MSNEREISRMQGVIDELGREIERLASRLRTALLDNAELAALKAQQGAVPEGYRWVPVEPTKAMLKAAKLSGVVDPRVSGYCYELMLSEAPAPAVEPAHSADAYNEEVERALFEADNQANYSRSQHDGTYVTDWVQDEWEGWCKCAKSRAKTVKPAHSEGVTLAHTRTGRVYIAGPMTGYDNYNFAAFNAEAAMLRDQGLHVENPADHGVMPGAEWADYLRYDIARLASCERVQLLPGWSKSKGASLEVHIARALGMPITYPGAAESHSESVQVPRELLGRALNRVVSFQSPDVESSLSSDLRALLAGGEV
jgi:hypothetical protein